MIVSNFICLGAMIHVSLGLVEEGIRELDFSVA
jgi:hypothetical protein